MNLPGGWTWATLGDVTKSIRNGLFASRPTADPSGTPILRISAVRDGLLHMNDVKYVQGLDADQLGKYSLREGDLLFTRYNGSRHLVGTCARVPSLSSALIHPDKLIRVVIDESVADGRFMAYQMASSGVRRFLEPRIRTTAGQSGVSGKDIKAIPVAVPPLDEQRRIVEILEAHLSRLDAGRNYFRASISKLPGLRLSTIAKHRRQLAISGTRLRRIDDFCDTSLGKMLDAKKSAGSPTAYLRNINVRWGYIDESDVWSVQLTAKERERLALRAGDLLVCEGGEPGRCAVWQGSTELMTFQKALHRVRVRESVARPQYVAAMLEEIIRSGRANRLFTGTTIKHLPQEKLRGLGIPIPPLEVQDRFLRHLADIGLAEKRLIEGLRAGLERADWLQGALLQVAFTGRLPTSGILPHSIEELQSV